MKSHLNIEASFTDDDDLLAGMISAARSDAEDLTGRSLVSQGWVYALDRFPVYQVSNYAPSRSDTDANGSLRFAAYGWNASQVIRVPKPPLISVTSVLYTDLSGTQQTLPSSGYQVDSISEPGRIAPAPGTVWPQVAPGVLNAVQINFTSGFSATPFRFLQAIKLRAAAYYASREEFLMGVSQPAPDWFERLLSLDRTQLFGVVTR